MARARLSASALSPTTESALASYPHCARRLVYNTSGILPMAHEAVFTMQSRQALNALTRPSITLKDVISESWELDGGHRTQPHTTSIV